MEVTDIHVDSNRPSKRSLEVSIAVKIKLKKQKELLDSDENYSGEEVEDEEEVEGEGEEERADYQYHEYIHEYESGFSEAPFDDFLQSYESEQGEGSLQHNARHNDYSMAKTHSRKSSDSNATFDMSVISEEDEPLNKSEEIILHEIQADKLHCSTEKEKGDREKNVNLRNKRNNLEQVEEPLIIAQKIDDTKQNILSDLLSDIVVDDFILIQTEKDYFPSDGDTKDENATSEGIESIPDEVRKNSCEETKDKSLMIEKETDWISNKKRTASVSTYSDYLESSESPHITSDEMRSSNEEEKEDDSTGIEESCNQNDLLLMKDELKHSYSNEVDLLGSYSTGAEVLDTLSTETDLLGSFAHTDFLASYKTEYELIDSSVTEAEVISSCNYELDSVKKTFATCKPACSVSEGKKDLCNEARELVNELKKEVEVLDLIASELDSQVYCTNEEITCTKDLGMNSKDQKVKIKVLEVDAKEQRMNIKDLVEDGKDFKLYIKNEEINSKEPGQDVKYPEEDSENQKVDDKDDIQDLRDQGLKTKDHGLNLKDDTNNVKNLRQDNQNEGIDIMDLELNIKDLRSSIENQEESFINQSLVERDHEQDIKEQYVGNEERVISNNVFRLFTKQELIDTVDEKVEELHVTDVIRTEYIEHEDLTEIDFVNNKVSIVSRDDVDDVRVVRDIMHIKEPIESKRFYEESNGGYREIEHNEQLEEINVITTTTTMTTQVFQSELNFDWDIRSPIEEGCLSQLSATIRNDYESAFKEYKNELMESELMNETAVSISNDLTDGIVDSSDYFSEFIEIAGVGACVKKVSDQGCKVEDKNTNKHEDNQKNDHSEEEALSSWTNTKNDDHSKSLEISGGDSGRDRLTPSSLLTGHDISDIELDTDLPLDDSVASQQNERSGRARPANFNWCNDISSLPDDSFGVTRDECVYKDDDDKLAISTKSRNSELTELCEKIDILNESYDLAELKEKIEDLNKNDDDFSEDIKEKMNEITAFQIEKGSNKKDKKSCSKLMKKNYEFTELSEKVDELNELLEPVYEKKVSQRLRYKNNKERFPAQNTSNEDILPKHKRGHVLRPSSEKLKYPRTPCPVEKNHKTVDFWEGDRVLCINDRVFDFGKPIEDISNKDKSTPWNYTNRNSQLRLMDYQALSKVANRSVSSRDDDTSLRSIDEPLMDFTRSTDRMSFSRSVEEPISNSSDDIVSIRSVDEPSSLQSSYNDEIELPHDDEFPFEHFIDDSVQSNEQNCPISMNDTFDQNCAENDSLDQIVDTLTSSLPDERVLSIEDLKSLPEQSEEVNRLSESRHGNLKSSDDIGSNMYISVSDIPKNPLSGMKKEMEWFNNKKLDFRWDSGIESQEDLSIVEDVETKKGAQTEQKNCTSNSSTNPDSRNENIKETHKDIFSGFFPTDSSFNDFFKNMKLFIVDPKNQTAHTANQVLNFDWDKDPHTCEDEVSTKDIAEEDADAFSETKSSIADMDHINLFREEDKPTLDLSELVSLIPSDDNDDQMTTDSYRELIEIERFEQLEKLCKESEKFPDFHWLAEESAKLSMSRTDPELAIREIGPNEVLSSSVKEIEQSIDQGVVQKKPSECWDSMKEKTCNESVIFDIPISWSRPYETLDKENNSPWNNQSDYETNVYYESTALDETYIEEEKVADLSTISETGEENITFSGEQCENDETSIEWFAVKQLGLNWDDMLENTIDTSQEYSDHVDILSAISEEELSLSESADIIRDMTSSMRDSTSLSNRLKARKRNNDVGEEICGEKDTHQHGSGINECFTCKSLDTVDEKLRELSNFIADSENTIKSSQISPSTVETYSSKRSSLAEGSPTSTTTPRSIPKKGGTILPTIEMSMKDNRTVSPSPEPRSMIPIATKRIKGVDCGSVSKRKKNDGAKRGSQMTNSMGSSYSQRENPVNENLLNSFNSEYSDDQCELDQNVAVDDNLSKSGRMLLHKSNNKIFDFNRNDELSVKRKIEINNNVKHNVSADESADIFDVGNNVINVCENDDVPSDNFFDKDVKTNLVSPLSESIVTIEDFVIITQDEIQYVTENLEQDRCEAKNVLNTSISSKSSRSNSLELSCFTNVDEIEDETFPSIPLSFSWDKKTKNHYDEIITKEIEDEEYTTEKNDIKNRTTDKILDNSSEKISDKNLGKGTETYWSKNMINETNNANRIVSGKNDINNLNENKENVNVNFKTDERENNEMNNSDSITKKFMIELTKRSKKGFKKGLNYINCLDGDLHDTKNCFENGLIETTMNSPKQLTITEKEVTIPLKEKTRRCSNNCQGNKNSIHNVTIGDKDSDNTDASSVVSVGDLGSNGDIQEVCDSCGQQVKEENELTSSELESDAEDQVLKIFVDLSIE